MSADKPVDLKRLLPRHLGFVMGGYATWASENNQDLESAYRQGSEVLKNSAISAIRLGVGYVSAYLFPASDWNRSQKETEARLAQIIRFCEKYTEEFAAEDIKVVHLGAREGLPPAVTRALDTLSAATKAGKKGVLALCVNYDGQQELVDATKKLLRERVDPVRLTVKDIEKALYQPEIPPVDLIIRTPGQYRQDGFLLWRARSAGLMFIDKPWPDFTKQDLKIIFKQYATT